MFPEHTALNILNILSHGVIQALGGSATPWPSLPLPSPTDLSVSHLSTQICSMSLLDHLGLGLLGLLGLPFQNPLQTK